MHLGMVVLLRRCSALGHTGGARQVLCLAKLVQLRGTFGRPRRSGHASSTPTRRARSTATARMIPCFPGTSARRGGWAGCARSGTPHCSAVQGKWQHRGKYSSKCSSVGILWSWSEESSVSLMEKIYIFNELTKIFYSILSCTKLRDDRNSW